MKVLVRVVGTLLLVGLILTRVNLGQIMDSFATLRPAYWVAAFLLLFFYAGVELPALESPRYRSWVWRDILRIPQVLFYWDVFQPCLAYFGGWRCGSGLVSGLQDER